MALEKLEEASATYTTRAAEKTSAGPPHWHGVDGLS